MLVLTTCANVGQHFGVLLQAQHDTGCCRTYQLAEEVGGVADIARQTGVVGVGGARRSLHLFAPTHPAQCDIQ